MTSADIARNFPQVRSSSATPLSTSRVRGTLAALGLSMLAGCGSGDPGPQRYDVSGKVSFAGKPVKYGQILFVPDTAKGNEGPAGSAAIVDGAYNTSTGGKGAVGGAVIVRLTGQDFDPVEASANESGNRTVLFRDYEVELEIPKQAVTKDFDVPADAAKPKPVKKPLPREV